MEDTTGFLPGKEQEQDGIVQAGRAMLDAIIDLRTPRFLLILRNAFGGAYASFNNYPTGADFVVALPTTRAAVMGPAGVDFVYKKELKAIKAAAKTMLADELKALQSSGADAKVSQEQAQSVVDSWVKAQQAELALRYEDELMNPKEALSLGSISQIAMPGDLRQVLGENMRFHLRHYQPEPMTGPQREFH